jgi:hypothetical protein
MPLGEHQQLGQNRIVSDRDPKDVELPMVCTCSEEGLATASALRQEILQRLSNGAEELRTRDVTMDNFLTAIVTSLNWDH